MAPILRNLVDKRNGMELIDFLNRQKKAESKVDQLQDTRALYVVQAKMDKGKVVKFGIAGNKSGHAAGRLYEYVTYYAEHDRDNACKGVIILYCGVTKYNKATDSEKTKVYQIEATLKKIVKAETALVANRGDERVNTTSMSVSKLLRTINDIAKTYGDVDADKANVTTRSQTKTDTPTTILRIDKRQTRSSKQPTGEPPPKEDDPDDPQTLVYYKEKRAREKAAATKSEESVIQPTDEILEVVSHGRTGKKGKTHYILRWSRPYTYEGKTSDTTDETFAKLQKLYTNKQIKKAQYEQFTNKIFEYQAAHPKAKFYD